MADRIRNVEKRFEEDLDVWICNLRLHIVNLPSQNNSSNVKQAIARPVLDPALSQSKVLMNLFQALIRSLIR